MLTSDEIEKVAERLEKRISDKRAWHKHPLLILLVTFLLTSVLGTMIGSQVNYIDHIKKSKLKGREERLLAKIQILNDFNNHFETYFAVCPAC